MCADRYFFEHKKRLSHRNKNIVNNLYETQISGVLHFNLCYCRLGRFHKRKIEEYYCLYCYSAGVKRSFEENESNWRLQSTLNNNKNKDKEYELWQLHLSQCTRCAQLEEANLSVWRTTNRLLDTECIHTNRCDFYEEPETHESVDYYAPLNPYSGLVGILFI